MLAYLWNTPDSGENKSQLTSAYLRLMKDRMLECLQSCLAAQVGWKGCIVTVSLCLPTRDLPSSLWTVVCGVWAVTKDRRSRILQYQHQADN